MKMQLQVALTAAFCMAEASAAAAETNSAPVIAAIVNAASYSSPVAPGSIVSIFGSNLASATQSASSAVPSLPFSLGGTSVNFNGAAAPLLFVSPGQINAQVPWSMKVGTSALSSAAVVVTTSMESSAPFQASTFSAGPGVFTSDSSGCGSSAALNVTSDGAISVNSESNSAAPGDYLEIFGTGFGIPAAIPADGTAVAVPDPFVGAAIHLDRAPAYILPSYTGLAPTLVGVEQINFQIPEGTREGCAVLLEVDQGFLLSPLVTISVSKNRGQCADPPVQSYGAVSIERTTASGTASDGESDVFNAVFPAAPALQRPPIPVMKPGTNQLNFWTPAPSLRVCPVAGYTELSAGTITIQPDSRPAISAPAIAGLNGVSYHQALPSGFVAPGGYTVTSEAGMPVAFQETFSIASGISIQTNLAPATRLSPFTTSAINWTGGDPDSIVRITMLRDTTYVASPKGVWYAKASAGSATLAFCSGGSGGSQKICSYGVQPSINGIGKGMVIVDVLPATGVADSITVPGLSQSVDFSWAYHYVFGGLTIED